MLWFKSYTSMLEEDLTHYQCAAIHRYSLVWANLEREPSRKEALKYMTRREYETALEYRNKVEKTVGVDIENAKRYRKHSKIRWLKDKDDKEQIVEDDISKEIKAKEEELRRLEEEEKILKELNKQIAEKKASIAEQSKNIEGKQDVSVVETTAIETSKQITETTTKSDTEAEEDENFNECWSVYPKTRIGNKSKAYRAYKRAIKEKRATPEKILEACEMYSECDEVKKGFAKGFEAWLNDDRFNLDYEKIDRIKRGCQTKADEDDDWDESTFYL